MNWVESLAVELGCTGEICCGDFFDRPDLNAEEVEAKVVTALNLKQLSAYSKKLIEGVLENRADFEK